MKGKSEFARERLGLRQSSGAFHSARLWASTKLNSLGKERNLCPGFIPEGCPRIDRRFNEKRQRTGAVQNAFTLIEVVISGSLMALILVSGYVCLSAAMSSQKLIEPRVEVLQSARVALALMSADLRCACSMSRDFDLLGMQRKLGEVEADNVDFATHNYTPRRSNEGDFCAVSLFLDKDPETGQLTLFRRRNPRIALDPLTGGNKEEIARGVAGLRFEYFDGFDWYESWGDVEGRGKAQNSMRERSNLNGLPEAVRITLWMQANPQKKKADALEAATATKEPALVFQTVARLNLAATANASSSSSADNSGSTTPNAGTEGGNQ